MGQNFIAFCPNNLGHSDNLNRVALQNIGGNIVEIISLSAGIQRQIRQMGQGMSCLRGVFKLSAFTALHIM